LIDTTHAATGSGPKPLAIARDFRFDLGVVFDAAGVERRRCSASPRAPPL
jgi:hypothetical protein